MALKLDMSKAYDRVEWPFLECVLSRLGFEHTFIQLIMLCVRSVSYSVKLNGDLFGPIQPERGLRRGDPLSPYLFLFCTEAFSSLIVDAEARGVIRGVTTSPSLPSVSHLLFANDTLIFCDVSSESAVEINEILHTYSLASGQLINLEKSTVVFSRNASTVVVDVVREILPIEVRS